MSGTVRHVPDPFDSPSKRAVRVRQRAFIEAFLTSGRPGWALTLCGPYCHDVDEIFAPLEMTGRRLTLVERDAARAAIIRRRIATDPAYQHVQLVEGELATFLEQTRETFDVVNLDFEGFCTASYLACVECLSTRGLLAERAVVFATFLSGRERDDERALLEDGFASARVLDGARLRHAGESVRSVIERSGRALDRSRARAREIPLPAVRPLGIAMQLFLYLSAPSQRTSTLGAEPVAGPLARACARAARDTHERERLERWCAQGAATLDPGVRDTLHAFLLERCDAVFGPEQGSIVASAIDAIGRRRSYVTRHARYEYASNRADAPPMLCLAFGLDDLSELRQRYASYLLALLRAILGDEDRNGFSAEQLRSALRAFLPELHRAHEEEQRAVFETVTGFIRPDSS